MSAGTSARRGLRSILLGGVAFAGAMMLSAAAPAGAPVKVCPSVPNAACHNEPAADTPVPAYAQASYKVYLDMKAKAHGGTRHTPATVPDWSGIWVRIGPPKFDVNQPGKMEDGKVSADLTPAGKAAFKKELADIAKGNEYDPISSCLPAGYPRLLASLFQWEFVNTPKQTWFLYEQQSEQRNIYTDGRGHVPQDEAYPLWDGDSIGFWDGDTLVVHTVNVRPSYYQRSQPYYSNKTSTVERIRMANPNLIEDDVTVWDPVNLAKPWHVVQHWGRVTSDDNRIDMWSCDENANVSKTATGGTNILLPGDKGYRDPDKLDLTPGR